MLLRAFGLRSIWVPSFVVNKAGNARLKAWINFEKWKENFVIKCLVCAHQCKKRFQYRVHSSRKNAGKKVSKMKVVKYFMDSGPTWTSKLTTNVDLVKVDNESIKVSSGIGQISFQFNLKAKFVHLWEKFSEAWRWKYRSNFIPLSRQRFRPLLACAPTGDLARKYCP